MLIEFDDSTGMELWRHEDLDGKAYALAVDANGDAFVAGSFERMLAVVARHANIWNCPNNAATELERKLDVLRNHCAAIGRDSNEIEVSEQCVVVLGKDDADFKQKWEFARGALGRVFDIEKSGFRGTPEQVVDQMRKRREQGVTFFTMLFGDFHQPETLELFAERVAPAFR